MAVTFQILLATVNCFQYDTFNMVRSGNKLAFGHGQIGEVKHSERENAGKVNPWWGLSTIYFNDFHQESQMLPFGTPCTDAIEINFTLSFSSTLS